MTTRTPHDRRRLAAIRHYFDTMQPSIDDYVTAGYELTTMGEYIARRAREHDAQQQAQQQQQTEQASEEPT